MAYWKGEMMTDKPTAPDLVALSEALDRALADRWNRGLGDAHQALEKAVFNEYRAGRLVQIDEGMRERVALGIWHKLGQIEENARAGQLTVEEVAVLADAALAALKGENA